MLGFASLAHYGSISGYHSHYCWGYIANLLEVDDQWLDAEVVLLLKILV